MIVDVAVCLDSDKEIYVFDHLPIVLRANYHEATATVTLPPGTWKICVGYKPSDPAHWVICFRHGTEEIVRARLTVKPLDKERA